ncbi:tyrosine-type recombinase/integrase [Paracoccus homiensis]|uniref:tyrosine-type recombinase/integrase n=1 Tax=Paracoccus homiensis TaxID=364199 RepID=UPI00398C9FC2
MNPGRIVSDAVTRPATRNHAAITDPKRFGELLRAIDEYSGDPSTLLALRLAPHVFLRDGAIRALKWSWVDAENAIIEIPAEAMKMKRPHLVPLSRQALDIVEEARQFSGRQEHVFPSAISRGRSISSNTLNVAIRRLGFSKDEMTFHGFRTTASTLLREIEGYGKRWTDRSIEAQLSHTDENKVRSAYDKSENLSERRVMMQAWSDQIDKSRSIQV